jgi:hypothetical protein
MRTVTGIFASRTAAEAVLPRLEEIGLTSEEISLLTPESGTEAVTSVPTTDGEQPGMGAAIGGVVGGAIGLSGGIQIATALSSLLIPGVGPVLAMGFAGAALAGAAGAFGGAKLGQVAENSLSEGLPKDELYFYVDELKKGRSVIICRSDDDSKLERARQVIAACAQVVDAAREQRGIGMGNATIDRVSDRNKSDRSER